MFTSNPNRNLHASGKYGMQCVELNPARHNLRPILGECPKRKGYSNKLPLQRMRAAQVKGEHASSLDQRNLHPTRHIVETGHGQRMVLLCL